MTEPNFHMYAGDDSLTLPLLALGGSGVVSVASHFIGSQLQAMIKSYLAGKVNDAIQIHIRYFPLFKALFSMANPIPAKKALQLQGWPVGPPRSPLTVSECIPSCKKRIIIFANFLNRKQHLK